MSKLPPPKFKVGDILRYDSGPTALMVVTYISENHGGSHRYYGQQCYGGGCGAYEYDCTLASAKDLTTWETERKRYHVKEKAYSVAWEDG
jgi:hypothetical protein